MLHFSVRKLRAFCLVAVSIACLWLTGDEARVMLPPKLAFAGAMPATVVWAWEEPEDLRSAADVGVAYLAETLMVGSAAGNAGAVRTAPRHQPLAVAPGARVMAVVRLIATPGFIDSPETRSQTAAALALAARSNGIRAFQVDFDATRSQRAFYASVLSQLRTQMPPGMPLSITALLSWCSASPEGGVWLSNLPIDEAVPMYFRLGGNSRPGGDKTGYTIREPKCRGSIGVSTDESWPPLQGNVRVYLFAPRPWTAAQLAALPEIHDRYRPAALNRVNDTARKPPNDTGLPPDTSASDTDTSQGGTP